ncbi:3'-5' exonuclease KapD [Cytobacillus oceanisediminis]|uniref:3'-5' exonuclease KapD n=2 Tax=Niallia TaxID=2837506 RepID=A0A941G9V3_NIACI|nr:MULTISPECIES: 3'-5' exonuclease KapD [Bacillaceae]MBQ6446864.1 3'-5' exonuclease KapD [Bacillus sp. (in: firmicutes)]MDU1846113.1 3'-5' exonuclease KapD [Niallia nealsonii]MBZ9533982.1 3'-5' exonuclease KapD [Cytobacillus oceanisediminis]MCB5235971.1 3'-5' exonuclease KapD [Niallia circulans]MED3791907.1 3'-5' exonuclease KapD [Niallia alba]
MEKQHLFIDFEFTMPEKSSKFKGFYPEIIEVGIVAVVGDSIREQFSSYVVPRKFSTLSRRCKSFLHISQEQVNNGISLYDLMKKLETICGGYQNIIVTWGNMDMKVLKDNCQKAQLPFIVSCKEVDLSMEYKRFFGDKNQTGLWKAVREYGREGTGKHHRALDDALTTYHIFRLVEQDKKYMGKSNQPTIGDLIDMSKLLNKFA